MSPIATIRSSKTGSFDRPFAPAPYDRRPWCGCKLTAGGARQATSCRVPLLLKRFGDIPKRQTQQIDARYSTNVPYRHPQRCDTGRFSAILAILAAIRSRITRFLLAGPFKGADYGRIWKPSAAISLAKPRTVSSETSYGSRPMFLRLARMLLGTVIIWQPQASAW